MTEYILQELKISATRAPADIDRKLDGAIAEALGVPRARVGDYRILNKSIDSRRGTPLLRYRLRIAGDRLPLPPASAEETAVPAQPELPQAPDLRHPIVGGTGPGGIFGALALALAGCRPIILDRGPEMARRCAGQEKFLAGRQLDPDNNLLIGEGGAGTFSDGKLYTGTRDPRRRFIIESFISAGAPPEIGYLNRPHIGTDNLRKVSVALRKRIVELGGEFRFDTEIEDVLTENGRCRGVRTAAGEKISAPAVLLAPGLGGRALIRRLFQKLGGALKPFQLGCRIEHPQEFIDRTQYRCRKRPAALGAAEYHLLSRPESALSVSSFCMCPGGTVVNASAWCGQSCTNGMSEFARDGKFANACLIATLPADYFASPDAAYERIEQIERAVFELGGNDYTLPAQDAHAFLKGRAGLASRESSCALGITPGRIDALLPPEIRDAIAAALLYFDRRCPGFLRYGKLIGVESCVSAPIRFERNADGSSPLPDLYLAGEGTGAAGGIVSAAADGFRCAEAMLRSAQVAKPPSQQ